MSQGDLVKIQSSVRQMAQVAEGTLLLELLQGPVLAFFDERNFQDKEALEEHLNDSLAQLSEKFGVKYKNVEQYLDELVKFVNILPKSYPNRDDQYQALIEKCGISEDLQLVAIFETLEGILQVKGEG